jgi:hypothetical protein
MKWGFVLYRSTILSIQVASRERLPYMRQLSSVNGTYFLERDVVDSSIAQTLDS